MLTLLGLIIIAGAVCWLAWETRRVSRLIGLYAAEVRLWRETLEQWDAQRPREEC